MGYTHLSQVKKVNYWTVQYGVTHLTQVNIVNYWTVQYGVYTSLTGKYS